MSIASSPSSAGGTPSIVDNGIVSGLNTTAIIQALMTSYQEPITDLQNQQSGLNSQAADYQAINKDLLTFQTAAQAISSGAGWGAVKATSSDSSAVTATAASGTPSGSVSFNVLSLAAANSLVSSGTVSSTADVVDTNPSFLLAQGGGQFGLAGLAAGSGLTIGSHSVVVSQASAAASTTGTGGVGNQTAITVGSGNDTLNVTVNGTAYALSLGASPGGGYTGAGLLSAVQSAISAAGASGALQAGYDGNGNLILSTTDQGSSQSLQVTGGSALATLGLSTMASAATGVDGVVTVDGTANTLTDVTAGATVSLNSGSGGVVSATLNALSALPTVNSSLLSTGTVTATNVSTGNGSLANLVANINAAGSGIIASAVQTGTNQYILQLSSSTTGSAANLSVDGGAFSSSSLGSMRTATAGSNAQIQVGGTGGYTLSSQTDTFAGLLPGLSVTVASATTTPVTVTVSPDATAMSTAVQGMVTAANTVLSDIGQYAGFNASTKVAGPLMGSAVLQNLQNQILGIFAATAGSSTLGNGAAVGVTLDSGQINFDQSTFESAFSANPTGVANLFTEGGGFSPSSPTYNGAVSFSFASASSRPGSYDVNISHSATQAADLGSTLSGGTVGTAETLTIGASGLSVNYATTAGESLANVASGINAALAGAGIALSAQVVNGQQLELTSSDFGSGAGFSVTSDNTGAGTTGLGGTTAGTAASFNGTDVAGTINGVAATGSGQFLSAPVADPTLSGLSLQVSVSGITSATDLGTFNYQPGIAQSLNSLTTAMSNPVNGSITLAAQGLTTQATSMNPEISFDQSLAAAEQKSLQAEYSQLEVTLGSIKSQSSALSSALASLSG
jgi:flagellar hook-associated protein 2